MSKDFNSVAGWTPGASGAEFVLHFTAISPIEELLFGTTTNWRQGKVNARTSISRVCN
jgi:hypothetical protein